MAVANQMNGKASFAVDGDAAFLRVNSRKPPHALLPGEVPRATNHRFEEGKPRPRHGVGLQRWGMPHDDLVTHSDNPSFGYGGPYANGYHSVPYQVGIAGLIAGRRYYYIQGNSEFITGEANPIPDAPSTTTRIEPGIFVCPDTFCIVVWATHETIDAQGTSRITARIIPLENTCAYKRFNDPNGFDNGILLTDEWRDGAGEDGGRGRAWRIVPGNVPQEIPLNGHDVWGTARLVQAHHTMLMARHGNERHYFLASAVDDTNNRIQLNCTPAWNSGDVVYLFDATGSSQILSGPNFNAPYFISNAGSNRVKFHPTRADAIAGTNAIDFGAATGRFFLERREPNPGPFGNGAPVIIMQPTDALSAFENGFRSAPATVVVTDSSDADNTITAPSHRLVVGDSTTSTLSTDATGTKYARPLSEHVLQLYDTQAHALAGGATGLLDITVDDQTGTITKTGAAALPMPPLRELCYYKGRIIGIVNGTKDTIVISDPFDFLHFSLFTGTVNANLGESGNANWLLPLGEDVLLIGKELKILAITGLSGASTGWKMDVVTEEYGGDAALAALNVGTDGWLFSRKGVASIVRTVAGERLGKSRALSSDIPEDLQDIDWSEAGLASSETWNGRYFLAVPIKGQTAGEVRNNRVIVYNFFNEGQQVQQSVIDGQLVGGIVDAGSVLPSWEGSWTGDFVQPYAFSRLKVFGEERLTFATPDGMICWFTDGFEDFNGAIETILTTRAYFGGARMLTLKGVLNWDTFNPAPTVTARTSGYNEEVTLTNDFSVDRTQYLVAGQEDYDPTTSTEEQFAAPHREDYSTSPEELLVGALDVHQNLTENLRMRLRDRAPQLVIENSQGSIRVNSVQLDAIAIGLRATRTS